MRSRGIALVTLLLVGAILLPQTGYCLYTGKIKNSQQEFSPTRLIVKLKSEADKKINLTGAQGKVTTGIAGLDVLNAKFSVQKQEKLFKEFKETALKH